MTPQQEADAWNAKHPVGTKVLLRKDTREMVTTTRSPASTLNENIAVTKFSVRKNRNSRKRRAPPHPAKKHTHLQFADVEFQLAREATMALFRGKRDDSQVDTLCFYRAVDEKPSAVVLVARQCQPNICHTILKYCLKAKMERVLRVSAVIIVSYDNCGLISFRRMRDCSRTSSEAIRAMIVVRPAAA